VELSLIKKADTERPRPETQAEAYRAQEAEAVSLGASKTGDSPPELARRRAKAAFADKAYALAHRSPPSRRHPTRA